MEDRLKSIGEIFYPRSTAARNRVVLRKQRFVHYTSASVAASILINKTVWMRNAITMNDFSETEHGTSCLTAAYNSEIGVRFKDGLDLLHPGFSQDFESRFNKWIPHFKTDTFITCLSEHDDSEDELGRLSMWRAYGGSNGIAMVLNNTPFIAITNQLRAYSSPVAYLSQSQFMEEFNLFVEKIASHRELMKSFLYEELMGIIFQAFRYHILCTKHPGFHEEKEWRVLYCPSLERSDYISESLETVREVPQIVYKIPLRHDPDAGLIGADIPSILDRIIIGPTQQALTVFQTMKALLIRAEVTDPEKKLFISSIPLRG